MRESGGKREMGHENMREQDCRVGGETECESNERYLDSGSNYENGEKSCGREILRNPQG